MKLQYYTIHFILYLNINLEHIITNNLNQLKLYILIIFKADYILVNAMSSQIATVLSFSCFCALISCKNYVVYYATTI